MSALNATIEEFREVSNNVKRLNTAGEENKDDIFFAMGAFEDFFIRFAKEKLNGTSPKFTYESNQFGKSIFLVCAGIFVEGSEIFYKVFQVEVIVLLCHKNSSNQGQMGREGGGEGERERGSERDKEEEREEEEEQEEKEEEEEEGGGGGRRGGRKRRKDEEEEEEGGRGGRRRRKKRREEEEEEEEEGGAGKSFLTFIEIYFWHRSFMFPFMLCESNDYHFTFSLADFRVERVFMYQRNEREFLLNGTKGNYIKIPPSNLYRGWYRTLTIFHY